MWRKKRFIIGLLVTALAVTASLGGVALAQEEEEDNQPDTLLGRVAEILEIDQQRVEDAFAQAKAEMKEDAQDRFFQKLIDEGIITEEEAVEYREWLESRPDMGEYKDQLKDWFESMPDVDISGGKGFKNFGHFGGLKDFGGFRGRGGMFGFDELNLRNQ